MISHQKSLRLKSVLLLTSFLLGSCAIKTRNDLKEEEVTKANLNQEKLEYSLKEDRSHLDELRKDIPEPIKQKNDELALVLDLMKDLKLHPSKVRNRFDKVLRKKRNAFNKKKRRERDDYTKNERKERDQFLAEIKKMREEFKDSKPDKEKRKRFNRDYKEKRDDFFNTAREKRLEKESIWREKSREFEAYIREKRYEFNDEMRSYSKRYYEYHKNKKLKKKTERKANRLRRQNRLYSPGDMFSTKSPSAAAKKEDDFDNIYSKPAMPLQPDDKEE